MSFIETQFFSVDTNPNSPATPIPGAAYDLTHDQTRFAELKTHFSDEEARLRLLEEMTVDLTTHFAELNRVGGFSYRYRLEQDTLVEDCLAGKPIKDMFAHQDNVISKLWLENVIPTLEQMPPDSFVFTYSARHTGTFEGGYDYAYVFHKLDADTINCHGLELVLEPLEQASVLNALYEASGQFHLLLTDSPDSDDVRGRAFWFPPHHYQSVADAYAQIIGEVVKPLRQHWSLQTTADYDVYLHEQEQRLLEQKQRSQALATSLVEDLDLVPLADLKHRLAQEQHKDLWRLYPDLMINAGLNGDSQVLLPCGFVDVNSSLGLGDLRFTAGSSLVETTTWSYHTGTCRHCHANNTDVGPCEICRSCEKIL